VDVPQIKNFNLKGRREICSSEATDKLNIIGPRREEAVLGEAEAR
jgi:hypothetical protein